MAWQDAYLPASFRGIPFFVESHEKSGGRNAVPHEIPDREKGFAEDMGRKTDGYNIKGHIVGDEYFFLRDALMAAVDSQESGVLIHPYLGLLDVQPRENTFSETWDKGRMCNFEINFVDAGDANVVFGAIDIVTGFITNVVALVAQVQNAYALAAAFSGLPAYAIDSAEAILNTFVSSVAKSTAKVRANQENLSKLNKDLEDFDTTKRAKMLNDSEGLVAGIDNILTQLKDLPIPPVEDNTVNYKAERPEAISIYDNVLDQAAVNEVQINAVPPVTSTRQKEADNSNAINDMIKQLAIARASESAAGQEYPSVESALVQRNELNDLIDAELLRESLADNLFQALKDVKSSNTAMIPDPRRILGTIKEIKLLQTQPSLVVAHNIYGNVQNENDILDRNKIKNPAFVDGTIRVVVNGQ